MKKFLVRIRSVQEAKEFVQICEQINGYAITHHRAEHIVPYAVCLILLSPTYSVELQMFIAPSRSLWIWNPHLQV